MVVNLTRQVPNSESPVLPGFPGSQNNRINPDRPGLGRIEPDKAGRPHRASVFGDESRSVGAATGGAMTRLTALATWNVVKVGGQPVRAFHANSAGASRIRNVKYGVRNGDCLPTGFCCQTNDFQFRRHGRVIAQGDYLGREIAPQGSEKPKENAWFGKAKYAISNGLP